MFHKALLLASLVGMTISASAQNILQIPRAARPPVVADYISGVPASKGVAVTDFRQFQPGDGTPASLPTTAYLSFDDAHFYAVFVAKADPKSVRAHIAKRENIIGDDELILELDTFNDKQRSFTFHINPYGVQADGKRTEGQDFDFNFDTQWVSDGQLTDDGFVAMMSIPFKSLRFKSADVQTWGIAVGRIIGANNEWSFWPAISKKNAAFVPQMAEMRISEKLIPGRNFQLMPSLNLASSKTLNRSDRSAAFFQSEHKARAGLDAKWVLGDAMALDLTLNPDFSEVESDEPQVVVDKRYEVLFPEKRPFFLENAGLFQTPQNLFFSRRVIQPKAGARLTGREANWSFAGLLINDDAVGKNLTTTSPNFGKEARVAVARVQNDFAKGSNLGALFTERRLGTLANTVFSTDLRYQLDENWTVNGQLAHSQSKDDHAIQRAGNLSFVEINRGGKNFIYSGKYLDIASNFDTTLAFLPRTDVRQFEQFVKFSKDIADNKYVQSFGPQMYSVLNKDHHGVLQDWFVDASFGVVTPSSSSLEVHTSSGYELYQAKGFNKHGMSVEFNSNATNWLNIGGQFGRSEAINYVPAKGLDVSLGDVRNLALFITLKPHPQFRIDETFFWNDLRSKLASGGQPASSFIYRDLLSRTRFSYQHDRYLGVRLVLDYDYLKVNDRLSGLDGGKRLNTDFQLSYVLSPGTTLYAGYADKRENIELIGNPSRLQMTENINLKTGRNIYLKLNYLFQL